MAFSRRAAGLILGAAALSLVVAISVKTTRHAAVAGRVAQVNAPESPAPTVARIAELEPPEMMVPPPQPPKHHSSPALDRIANSGFLERAKADTPAAAAAAVRELDEALHLDPDEPYLRFLRVAFSCYAGTAPPQLVADIEALPAVRDLGDLSPDNQLAALKSFARYAAGDHQGAMRDLDAAIALGPDKAPHLFNDGKVRPSLSPRPCTWTLADIDALAKEFPSDPRPLIYRGLYLSAFLAYRPGPDYKPVIDAFTKAEALAPTSPQAPYFIGWLYASRIGGLFSLANARCLPNVSPRSVACRVLDESRARAADALTRAIAIDPKFFPAYLERANLLVRMKEFKQAIRDYDSALSLVPSPADAQLIYNDRGLAKVEVGMLREAIADYTQRIALGCDAQCNTFENRAAAYRRIGDHQAVLADLNQALARKLQMAGFIMKLALFRRIYPEYDSTPDAALYSKLRLIMAPDLAPDAFARDFASGEGTAGTFFPQLYVERGDAYAALGQEVQANAEYDRVSHAFPEWVDVAFTTQDGRRVRVPDEP